MSVPFRGGLADEFVQFRPVTPTVEAIFEPPVLGPIGLVQHPANPLPLFVAVHGYRDPAVVSPAGVATVGRHARIAVADPGLCPSVGGEVQEGLGHRGAGGLSLGYVDKLALAGAQAVHQGRHHREHRLLGGGVVGIGNLRQQRRSVGIAGHVNQARRSLGGRTGGPEIGPGTGETVARGRHHDDVRLDAAQVFVFQMEVSDGPGREILREHIADGNQVLQDFHAGGVGQVQGDAQLVAVMLVEIGPPVPELSFGFVLVESVAAVAFQSLARFQADDLGPHVGQHLHGPRDSDELSHLDDPHSGQRTGQIHVISIRYSRCHITPIARSRDISSLV